MFSNLPFSAVLAAHVLAAAAWFGSMFYSFSVLQPRAKAYFRSMSRFEDFTAYIAAGARWKVLGGSAFVAVTGGVLLLLHGDAPLLWWAIMIGKTALLCVTLTIFAYASWRLWPQRLFAAESEAPVYQRKFAAVALSLIIIVGICFVLSIVAAHGVR